jgi:hypothetical protein
MQRHRRKKIGILLAVLAPVVFVALVLTDVQVVTMSSRHFQETGATSSSLRLHWPIFIPALMFSVGVVLAVLPRDGKEGTQEA